MPSYVINGTLTLGSDPTAPTQAATKGYVDTKVTNIDAGHMRGAASMPAGRMPSLSGDLVANQGGTALNLTSTGVVPGSYTKVRTDSNGRIVEGVSNIVGDYAAHVSFNNILPVSRPNSLAGYGITDAVRADGTTMLGVVSLSASSFSTTEIINKGFVDSTLAAAMAGKTIETGDIIARPTVDTPVGYFRCNGGMVSKMTYPGLYAMIGDGGVADITNKNYGRPWEQQNFNDSPTTSAGGWTNNASAAMVANIWYGSSVVVTKNRIYMLGGENGGGVTALTQSASVASDGTIGAWVAGTPMPVALSRSTAIVVKNKLYLIGGYVTGGGPTATIQTANINSDGTLGTFSAASASLPQSLMMSSAVYIGSRIYVLGGSTTSTSFAGVYSAPVDANGVIGAWVAESNPLAYATQSGALCVTSSMIYLIGGFRTGVGAPATYQSAPINANGTIGSWTTSANVVPSGLYGAVTFNTKNRIFLIGGTNAAGDINTDVYTAPINSDGTIGSWTSYAFTGISVTNGHLAVTKDKVNIIAGLQAGGFTYTQTQVAAISGGLNDYSEYYAIPSENILNTGKPWAQQYEINKDQPNGISGWTAGTALPASLKNAQAVITENRAYLIGGSTGASVSSAVYTAPVNTDGTLGTWAVGPSLPQAVSDAQAVVIKDKIFLIGGGNGVTQLNTVYTASIAADGTISSWVLASTLPETFSRGQAIVTGPRLYILGGLFAGAPSNKSYFADINSDGTLGSWSLGGNIPHILSDAKLLVAKRNLYLMGGVNDSVVLNTHCRCAILPDGSLGDWTNLMTPVVTNLYGVNSSALPVNVGSAKIVGKGGDGGTSTTVSLSGSGSDTIALGTTTVAITGKGVDVEGVYGYSLANGRPWEQQYDFNKTSQSGNIGTWVASADAPAASEAGATFVTKNRIYYIVGGRSAAVYTAVINPDGTIGTWSPSASMPEVQSTPSVVIIKNKVYVFATEVAGATYYAYKADVNADGTIGAWTGYADCPAFLNKYNAVVVRSKLYLIGAYFNGSAWVMFVYGTTIAADGTLGTWVTYGTIPAAMQSPTVIATSGFVYILGGQTDKVYGAAIASDGSLGSWMAKPLLPVGLQETKAFVTREKVYLVGGHTNSGSHSNKVYFAALTAAGELVPGWTETTNLPGYLKLSTLTAVNGRLHFIGARGGLTQGSMTAVLPISYSAPISGGLNDYSPYYDGTSYAATAPISSSFGGRPWEQQVFNNSATTTLSSWTYANTSFPYDAVQGQVAVVTKNRVYLMGGTNDTSARSNIITAPINTDGRIGTFYLLATDLPQGISHAAYIVTKNKFYLIGGLTPTPAALNKVYVATINADGTLSTFTQEASTLPSPVRKASAIFTGTRVYVLGGQGSSNASAAVYSAPVDANGTIGTWVNESAALARATYQSSVCVTPRYVYLIGGQDDNGVHAVVQRAPIDGSGNIGSWSITATPLPVGVRAANSFSTKNTVFVTGGTRSTETISSTTYAAVIAADGTLGNWSVVTSPTYPVSDGCVVITKDRVNILSGFINAYDANFTIQSATLSGGLNDYSFYYSGADTANTTITLNGVTYTFNGGTTIVPSTLFTHNATIPSSPAASYTFSVPPGGSLSIAYQAATTGNTTLSGSGSMNFPASTTRISMTAKGANGDPVGGTTGASSTITVNGTTYTFPGGQGVPAVESTQSVTLPGNAAQVMTYSLQTGVTAAVNYDHTPSTSGASTTVTLNGTTYTFAGGVAGPAVETTYNVNFPTTGVSYSNNVPAYGYARLEYETPTSGSALPVATADFTTYVTGNTAYAIGGTQAGTPITTVYTAAIDASGVLSPWATSTSLGSALGEAELIATKTKAYLLGGRNASGVTPAVQYATITGGRNDYSGIYTAAANTTHTPNFKLPDFTSIENSATYYYIKY